MRNILDQTTHFMFRAIISENRACEIMWKNMVETGRPHMIIYCRTEKMRFVCRI